MNENLQSDRGSAAQLNNPPPDMAFDPDAELLERQRRKAAVEQANRQVDRAKGLLDKAVNSDGLFDQEAARNLLATRTNEQREAQLRLDELTEQPEKIN